MSRKVAFITGASRGIGRASALALAGKGFDVVATARTLHEGEKHDYRSTREEAALDSLPGSVEATAAAVRAAGREALAIRLDLLDFASIEAAVEQTFAEWGRIDLLLNNGITQGPGSLSPFLEIEEADFRRILEGNLLAQLHITQLVVPRMLSQGGGTVMNMTSAVALMDPPAATGKGGWGFAYAASKAAFNRMVGILRAEFGAQGIRACNINPGHVITESMKARTADGNPYEEHFKGCPPEVPASVVAWLASSDEAWELVGPEPVNAMRWCKKQQLYPEWS